jgi:hypothetical protein
MKYALAILVLLASLLSSAEARHRRHWHDQGDSYGAYQPSSEDAKGTQGKAPTVASLIPSNWTAEPPRKEWDGKRFVSPDGSAWVALYKSTAGSEPVADHMKSIAFAPNETVTYLRGERTWVAVSGYRESKIFYRKATLVCGGAAWNQIAMEYPIESKSQMEPMVTAMAQALDNTQAECGATAAKPQESKP